MLASKQELQKVATILRGTSKPFRVMMVELAKDGAQRVLDGLAICCASDKCTCKLCTHPAKTPRITPGRKQPQSRWHRLTPL